MGKVNKESLDEKIKTLNSQIVELEKQNSQLKPLAQQSQKKLLELQSEIKIQKRHFFYLSFVSPLHFLFLAIILAPY